MKKLILVLFLLLPTQALPDILKTQVDGSANTYNLKVEFGYPTAWTVSIGTAPITLAIQSLETCPSGYEKLREYTTHEGDEYFLHFVVRCITPATPAAGQ